MPLEYVKCPKCGLIAAPDVVQVHLCELILRQLEEVRRRLNG